MPMTGPAELDWFNRLETTARRRAWIFGGAVGGVMSGLVLIGTLVSPPGAEELLYYFGSIGTILAFAIGFPLFLGYVSRRRVRRLRPLGPYVAAAGWPMSRGIMLVLRDGMVLTFLGGTVVCLMFFGPGGTVFHPSPEEATRWTRWRFTKPLGIVARRRGPPHVLAELEALRIRMGLAASACVVRQAKVPTADSTKPQWVVWAVFVSGFNPFSPPRGDSVAAELPAIGTLVRRTLEYLAPMAGVVPTT